MHPDHSDHSDHSDYLENLDRARRRILVALDVPTLPEALSLVQGLQGQVGGFKVGLELCSGAGVPPVVEAISRAGGSVFLDLKLKDIPNTVAGAVRAIASLPTGGVRMLTLHCDGGRAMLRAAAEALRLLRSRQETQPPLLLGVTVLTSLGQDTLTGELGIPGPLDSYVVRLARLAHEAGLDGVVASPHEVAPIRRACGSHLLVVTPGVRPTWAAAAGDQRRTMTPAEACKAGADYLVIGRPVTAAPPEEGGPAAAVDRIVKEIAAV